VVIGRSPSADIVIGDDFVSARHARVSPAGNDAIVEDLGSTNGTLLNGLPLSVPTTLRPGDTIDIGKLRLKVDR
jgi:pSer/pThr/pTyr-binding forkhead associated (FHA) protein